MKEKLCELISVKKIVALLLVLSFIVAVFVFKSDDLIKQFSTIVMMVISFYFGQSTVKDVNK